MVRRKKPHFEKGRVAQGKSSTYPFFKFLKKNLHIKNISVIIMLMPKPIDTIILGKIGQYIIEGLTEEEACILSDASYDNLVILKENNEDIRNYIAKQRVLFKHAHLKEMQTKKSEKTSQWLLERLRPEDFYIGARSRTPQTINVIGTIIQQIQNDNTRPLISRTREDRLNEGSEPNQDNTGPARVIEVLN